MDVSSTICERKLYALFDPSGSDVPNVKLCITIMNGESCFWISIRKPSYVSREVRALQGMVAPSYGPGLGTAIVGGRNDDDDESAADPELSPCDDDDDEDDVGGGGGGGASPLLVGNGGGGGGGASHCIFINNGF